MADKTGIQWTEATWNPIAGCSLVSPGCTNCYAMREAGGRMKSLAKYAGLTAPAKPGPVWTGEVRWWEPGFLQPLQWTRPRRIFVNSMSDLFHEAVPEGWIDRVHALMSQCPQHRFQVLTKRDERMWRYLEKRPGNDLGYRWALKAVAVAQPGNDIGPYPGIPLPNVWYGVSVEDRARLGRVDRLRATPAAVRFLSLEPLLEDLGRLDLAGIDWVIVGGESGPAARPMQPDWARRLRDQCQAAAVPFFMKQMAKKAPIPADLLIREYPP
jgi:protein gp37